MLAEKYRLKSSARLVSVLNADDTLFAKNWWIEPLAAAFRLTQIEFQDVVQEETQWLTTHAIGVVPESAVAIKLAVERCMFEIPDHQLSQRYLWGIGEASSRRFFTGFPEILVESSQYVERASGGAVRFEAEIATCGLHAIVDGMTSAFRRKHPGLLRIPSGQQLEYDEIDVPATGVVGAYCTADKALAIRYVHARGVPGENIFFVGNGQADIAGARQTKKLNGTIAHVYPIYPDPDSSEWSRLESERVFAQIRKFDPNCGFYVAQWRANSGNKNAGWALNEWLTHRLHTWHESTTHK